jgi:hypothetical protein
MFRWLLGALLGIVSVLMVIFALFFSVGDFLQYRRMQRL